MTGIACLACLLLGHLKIEYVCPKTGQPVKACLRCRRAS